jgi:pilus assembly protein Flp/PilA
MLKSRLIEFLKDEEGASAIEYALMAAMVAVVVATFVTPIGDAIKSIFGKIQTCLSGGACT